MQSRDIRIHHKQRMKDRALQIAKAQRFNNDPQGINEMRKENLIHNADNLTICSCWMCGNPRRYFKGKYQQTIQERRALA